MKGLYTVKENPAPAWATSTPLTQAAEGEEEQTHTTQGFGAYLLKSLSDFLTDSLAQEFQDSCVPGDCRLGIWRLVVHTGSTDPGEYVPKKHTQTPPSPQSTVLPLPWYFKNYFPIFSAREKPTTGTSSGPICVFSLNASFSFFLLGFILSVLGGLMSTWSGLLWNFLPAPHSWKNTEFNSSGVFAETGFFLPVPEHVLLSTRAGGISISCQCPLLDCAVVDIPSAHIY